MPRPAKRGVAATETIRFRVTPGEYDRIEEARGFRSLSDFVRDTVMRQVASLDEPISRHRHTRGEVIGETTVKGVTKRTYRCTGCGEPLGD